MRLDPARPGLDNERLGDWLAARGQGPHARRMLWDLFTVSALNVAGDDASMTLAATVVKTALLGKKDAADIGTPAIPLGDLHGHAGARLLQRLGAEVRMGAKVAAVEAAAGGGFLVRLTDRALPTDSTPFPPHENTAADAHPTGADQAGGSQIHADGVVLAVPPDVAARLVPASGPVAGAGSAGTEPAGTGSASTGSASTESAGAGSAGTGPGPDRWRDLGASPIVNVHVIYDRKVTELPFAAAVDSPVQWVFDRTRPSGLPSGQYLAISLSAADDLVDVTTARLRERFVPALAELFPAARDAQITDFFVTRERRATFRQVPGCAELRPGAATALPGLVLAGAWTDTGWPDTMEGAVRSGLNAARELRHGLPAQPPAGRRTDVVAGATT
jgi:hypothetical protein